MKPLVTSNILFGVVEMLQKIKFMVDISRGHYYKIKVLTKSQLHNNTQHVVYFYSSSHQPNIF